jgi:hypothetical protein
MVGLSDEEEDVLSFGSLTMSRSHQSTESLLAALKTEQPIVAGSMSPILPSENTWTDDPPADHHHWATEGVEMELFDNNSPNIDDDNEYFTLATKNSEQWLIKPPGAADFAIYQGRSPLSHQPVLSKGSNIQWLVC